MSRGKREEQVQNLTRFIKIKKLTWIVRNRFYHLLLDPFSLYPLTTPSISSSSPQQPYPFPHLFPNCAKLALINSLNSQAAVPFFRNSTLHIPSSMFHSLRTGQSERGGISRRILESSPTQILNLIPSNQPESLPLSPQQLSLPLWHCWIWDQGSEKSWKVVKWVV